jgi:hypothetical protein
MPGTPCRTLLATVPRSRALLQMHSTRTFRMDAHIDIYGCGGRHDHARAGCLESLNLVESPEKRPLKIAFVSSHFV